MNTDEDLLLDLLSSLSKRGPIDAIGKGANSVGRTLQDALGIKHSTNTKNKLFNYIISGTTSPGGYGRTNLFACVPDWNASNMKSSKELVNEFGREDIKRGYSKSLFCTSTSNGPNGFNLVLKVKPSVKSLEECYLIGDVKRPLLVWDTVRLQTKLQALKKIAIITALPLTTGSKTRYHYRYVDLFERPDAAEFYDLLELGSITIDHLISIKEGTTQAREQGPLFKIRNDCREVLYGKFKRMDLMNL